MRRNSGGGCRRCCQQAWMTRNSGGSSRRSDVASKLEWEDWPVEVEAAVEGAEKVADALGSDGDPELVDVSVQHIK